MDTWIVSRQPIGVYNPPLSLTSSEDGLKVCTFSPPTHLNNLKLTPQPQSFTFFYKAHILAGQVRTDDKHVLDFAWLTKEEMESRVDKDYWLGIKDMLSDF
jgi:large subunit ribosomal protein L46